MHKRSTTSYDRHGSARSLVSTRSTDSGPRFQRQDHGRRDQELFSSTHKHFQPRRVVEVEPVVLLSSEAMAKLYDEQLRLTSLAGRESARSPSSKKSREPQDEPRASDSSSRPRTSMSSSVAPQSPSSVSDDETVLLERPVALEHTLLRLGHLMSPRHVLTATQRECQVCYESMDVQDANTCTSCRGSFCSNCMRWYIEYKIIEGEVSPKKLVCPAPQCHEPLSEEFIKTFVSAEVYAKYLLYRENQRPGVRFCPRAGCCARINEPLFSKARRVHCESCQHDSCMKCGDGFHLVPTCRRKERRYGKWRKRSNVRKCPSCKSDIEKQGGCAHMKCFQCDNEFCWSCLRPWETHDETLCVPLTFLKSKNPRYGPCKPVRAVTKGAVVGAAAVVALAGAGVAVVVLPPVLLYQWVRDSPRFHGRAALDSNAFIIE